VFNKPSSDGSGKANLVPAPGETAWGVIWSIPGEAWASLDRFEPGYTRAPCRVRDASGHWHAAQTYLFAQPGPEQLPFATYLAYLCEGAREHDLPADYIRGLRARPSRPDPAQDPD
jgi:hypothetical protein